MIYQNKHSTHRVVHIQTEEGTAKLTDDVVCGKQMYTELDPDECYASLKALTSHPISGREVICPECAKHPDYPFVVLAGLDNRQSTEGFE